MNLDRLDQFVRIVDTGSMSAAARAVHLTQPALSRSLKLLEEELGAPLFLREGRRLVPTAAGRALLPRARAVLAQVAALAKDVEQAAERDYHDLRIGTVDSVATWLLPRAIPALLDAFPGLRVKLHTARTAALLERLEAGTLDVALVAWSGPPQPRAAAVGPYQLRFWGRADRFASLADATTEEQVQVHPIVEIEPQPGQPTMVPEHAETFALANSLASVKALVLEGFGVGALLDFMLTPEERARLVCAPIGHDPDCALWVLPSPAWSGDAPSRIEEALASSLRRVLDTPADRGR
ncbi:MAG: hypothetical protein AMXMBFR64_15380 [Myxococcales bacterium]